MIYIDNKSNKYISGGRTPKQIITNVTYCEKHKWDMGYVYSSNLCETHSLFLVVSGHIKFKSKSITEGNIIYISKFSNYIFTTVKPSCVIEINFEYSDRIPFFDSSYNITNASLEIQDYTEKIYSAKYFNNSLSGIREGLLLNLINALNISYNTCADELSIYKICCEWIEKNAADYITAQDVAKSMNYTVAHLNRIVKKHYGKCLSTLIADKRVLIIKQISRATSYSTNEIAVRLGFESAELLRKYFKYHTGVSLKEYRKDKR